MPNDQHPQIPQHERFRVVDGVAQFRIDRMWCDIDTLRGAEREDCACVARCAWLDVAQQLVDEATPHSEIRVIAELLQAELNADAWAAWLKGD